MKKMLTQVNSLNYLKLLQHQLSTLHLKPDAINIAGLTASEAATGLLLITPGDSLWEKSYEEYRESHETEV